MSKKKQEEEATQPVAIDVTPYDGGGLLGEKDKEQGAADE
jgi:hypothetical protein